jgi:hypothetical protein
MVIPIAAPDPIEAIKFRMEQLEVKAGMYSWPKGVLNCKMINFIEYLLKAG